MSKSSGLIERLKSHQPATWALLKLAALDDLVVIDEESDAVTATTRLLSNATGLNDTIASLVDSCAERSSDPPKPSTQPAP
jgi:hypothetical protein